MTNAGLGAVLLDRERGAEKLLEAALAWLRAHPESLDADRRAATLSLLRATRPAMAAFAALAETLDRELASSGTGELLDALATRFRSARERLVRDAVAHLTSTGIRKVLTLSYSSTVAAVLEAARVHLDEVHVLESLPGGEGRRLAARLRRTLAGVRLHPDGEMACAVEAVDAGVIGADSLYPNGSVLNKVGSAELARRLHRAGKPLVVVATTSKRLAAGLGDPPPEAAAFELVPARWIARVISDQDD